MYIREKEYNNEVAFVWKRFCYCQVPKQRSTIFDKKMEEVQPVPATPLPYTWSQTLSEVTVTIPVAAGTRGRDVNCKITPTRLVVGLKGQEKPFIEVALLHLYKTAFHWALTFFSLGRTTPKDKT